jgi:hypothetical protein
LTLPGSGDRFVQTDAGNVQDSMARFADAASEDGAAIQEGHQ